MFVGGPEKLPSRSSPIQVLHINYSNSKSDFRGPVHVYTELRNLATDPGLNLG